jgi:hypothetical protein
MADTTGGTFDAVSALAFALGAIVVATSLASLLLTLLAVVGIPL